MDTAPATATATKPSEYQEKIFEWASDAEGGNAVVQAVAGSGKTTTLRMTAERTASSIRVVCFNKPVAEELQRKMPPRAECSTLHSVGKRAWGGRVEVASDKTRRIFKWLQESGKVPRWLQPGKVAKVVGLAKSEGLVPEGTENMTGLVPDTKEQWLSMFEHYGVDTDERITPDILIHAAKQVLVQSIEYAPRIIDFDDMLYMPTLTDGIVFQRSPWVYVDELQDVSGLQREMVLRMTEAGGRFLGVGDRAQAIYGWRGADVGSMDKIAARTKAIELPLSICYRCPVKVIELAKLIVPQIEPAPNAPEGIVEYRDEFKASEIEPGHLIICRNKAPGVKLAYRLLGAGLKVRVLGGQNVGQGIVTFIESLTQSDSVDEMLAALVRRTTRDIARAEKIDDEAAVEEALDREATVRAIAEGCRADSVQTLLRHIRDLFDGPREGRVLVGTIHAVKGLEADNVWFLDRHLIPSRGAKKDWQRSQEKNLEYVGITRARKALRFVKSEGLR